MPVAATAPVRMRRPRPSRHEVLGARAARRRRQFLFALSLALGGMAGAILGVLEPAPFGSPSFVRWVLASLLPGIAAGVLAGPRIWAANIVVAIVSITTVTALVPWIGFGITMTALAVLVVGYAGRGLWSLVTQGRFWVPLEREGDAPRPGGSVPNDGPGFLKLKKPTVAASTPPERAFRTRLWR